MRNLLIYVLLGIICRQVCGYKGLVETLIWPLGMISTLLMALMNNHTNREATRLEEVSDED